MLNNLKTNHQSDNRKFWKTMRGMRTWSVLKNIYSKRRNEGNWSNYKRQRHSCINLLCNAKAKYFQKLTMKDMSDNKKFWKTMTHYFSNKGLNSRKLILKQNRIINEEKELATVMNTFFVNIAEVLDKQN